MPPRIDGRVGLSAWLTVHGSFPAFLYYGAPRAQYFGTVRTLFLGNTQHHEIAG